MKNIRIPRAVCAAIGDVLIGSHAALDALFESSGAPGEPPNLAHQYKWKEWLFRAGNDPEVDSLAVLGNVLEEFMDIHPQEDSKEYEGWANKRDKIVNVLEEHGFRYFRGGRVLPNDASVISSEVEQSISTIVSVSKPSKIEDLLMILVRGLPRAMHPLTHRRKGAQSLSFSSEYDVQDLLHALLRPWVADIRPEEFTPSYAGSSTRMDFLLPAYSLVIELKFVRDRNHGKRIGDELIIDIEHYRRHPNCKFLWCVIYDPEKLLLNAEGLKNDLNGRRDTPDGTVTVHVLVL
jgi:hypothetical protein